MGISDATAVWHGDKLYMGGETSGSFRDEARLYIYTPTTDIWDTLIDTPVYLFALTTYHSQLVLIGGMEYVGKNVEGNITNKLWTLSEDDHWQETLPPMRTKRRRACAVSYSDHLLVAGGITSKGISNIVEIFNSSHCWLFAPSLPVGYYNLKSATFDCYWYLMGGDNGGLLAQKNAVYSASLDSLLASSQSTSQPSSVWKRLTDVPYPYSGVAVFGSRLIAIGGRKGVAPLSSTIYAYSFHTSSWIHVGDMPLALSSVCSVVLPTGELMVVGGLPMVFLKNVLKAVIKGNFSIIRGIEYI